MTDLTDPAEVRGKKLVDPAGAEIGEARETYLEHDSGRPAFALVKTGLFGSKHTFVPLRGASLDGPRIWVTVEKAQVKDAPRIDPDEELSPREEGDLYRHYGLEGARATQGQKPETDEQAHEEPAGESEPSRADAFPADRQDQPGAATARTDSGAEQETFAHRSSGDEGLPRLRRYVVTEDIQVTVPVQREEVRVESPEGAAREESQPERGAPAEEGQPAHRDEQAPERGEQQAPPR